jgi:hypothetical protein
MYPQTGWKKFACDLNLEAGCQITFLYEGDSEMVIKVFDETSCRGGTTPASPAQAPTVLPEYSSFAAKMATGQF